MYIDFLFMKNSKFFRLFNTLTEEELKKFLSFVHVMYSTYRNQTILLEYIAETLSTKEELNFTKALVYKAVFKKDMVTVSDKKNLSNLLSDLTKWLENFFLCEYGEKFSFARSQLVKEIYKKRNLYKDYINTIKQAKSQNTRQVKNEYWFLNDYTCNSLLYFTSEEDEHRISQSYLVEGLTRLEQFYTLTKVTLLCEMMNRKFVLAENLEIAEVHNIGKYNEEPLINSYYLLFQLYSDPSYNKFYKLKEAITTLKNIDDHVHLKLLFYAINYAAAQYRLGQEVFLKEAFALYKFGLERKIILENGFLSEMAFKNIVFIACLLKEYAWAQQFIEEWKVYLKKDSRNDLTSFCMSRIYCDNGSFELAKDILERTTFFNDFYNAESRLLLIKCYYELGDFEKTLSECINLESFLQRKTKINKEYKQGGLNFLRLVKKIINRRKKEKLMDTIEQKDVLFFKEWLIEKIKFLP